MQGTVWFNEKPLAVAGNLAHNVRMEATVLEARKLRPAIIQRIEAMDDESSVPTG
jgi:hypothetical protein